MSLADDLSVVVVGIAGRKRHQDGIAALRTHIINIFTHVAAIGVDGLVLACLLDSHLQGVVTHTGDAGPGTTGVIGSVVVMADGDNHPVAWTDGLLDGLPQLVIERAAAHATKRLVLDGDLGGVEILVGIVSPSPLAIVTITQSTCSHR